MSAAKKSSKRTSKSVTASGSDALIARFAKAHTDRVNAIAFLPLGRLLVSGSLDRLVHLWDVSTQNRIATHQKKTKQWRIISVAASPNGNTVVSVSEGFKGSAKGMHEPFLWNLISGTKTEIGEPDSFYPEVCGPVFSASGDVVVFGGAKLRRFDAITGKQIGQPYPDSSCQAVAFSPADQKIVTGNHKGVISIWGDAGEMQRSLKGHKVAVSHLAFSPNGKWLGSTDTDGLIRIWDYQKGKEVRKWAGDWKTVESLSFLPDNASLISFHDSGENSVVRRWNIERVAEASTWKPSAKWIETIAVCPTGKQIALGLGCDGSGHGQIEIWKLPSVLPAS